MKYYLIASVLLLASCTRPPATHPPHSEPIGLDTPPADTSTDREFVRINSANPAENGPAQAPVKLHLFPSDAGTAPQEVVRRRLFGLLPAKAVASEKLAEASRSLRKCKGCTFNLVAGNQMNVGKKGQALGDGASNVQTGKKSGDIIKADSGASINKATGAGSAQLTHGNNNTPTLTAPVQQPPDWKAMLAKPVGMALASVGTVLVVGGCIFLFAAYKRRKKLLA